MPKFRFEAVDQKGKQVSGNVEAADEATAEAMLREKNLFPTAITSAAAATAAKGGAAAKAKKKPAAKGEASGMQKEIKMPALFQKVKAKELMAFTVSWPRW